MVLEVEERRHGKTWQESSGRVLLTVRNATRRWRSGDRFEATIRLRRPRNFGNPGEFDYEQYLARRRIYCTGYAISDKPWMRLPAESHVSWREHLRLLAGSTLDQVASPELRPIVAALLLGESASIPPETRQRYARAGVSHVLAISGLHIGLVAAAAYACCRWLLSRSEQLMLRFNVPKLATVASLPPLIAYAAVAGGSAATLRATTMVTLALAALLLDRPRHWYASLAAAAAICLLSPGALCEASFQLSFAAVIAIIAAGARVHESYNRFAEQRLLHLTSPRRLAVERWFVLSQAVTTIALLATAPLTLYHFQQLSLVGLISNIFIIPITGMAAVSLGLLGVLVNPILPGVAGVLLGLCCDFVNVGDHMTAFFATLPGARLNLPSPDPVDIAAYYTLLAMPLVRDRRVRRRATAATLFLIAILVSYSYADRYKNPDLRVTFLSVGQGDSTLIEFPSGQVMLVDGGGLSTTFDVGRRIVGPLLRRRKLRTVDFLVLTHPDFDHYGGLASIAEDFNVSEFWTNGAQGTGGRYLAHRRRIATSGVAPRVVLRGFEQSIGSVRLRVLHPDSSNVGNRNDSSLTIQLSYAGESVLLTGDLEEAGERTLLHRYRTDLRSVVLKVPHHGSRTSSSQGLIAAVEPSWAVASCGYRNRYSMPHPDIRARYQSRNIRFLRTDLDGAVEVRIPPRGGIAFEIGRRWRRSYNAAHSVRPMGHIPFRLTGWENAA